MMSKSIGIPHTAEIQRARATPVQSWARALVLKQLKKLTWGRVVIYEADQRLAFGEMEGTNPVQGAIVVNSPRFFTRLLFNGSVGAGEGYMAGDWTSSDLTAVIRIMVRNRDLLGRMDGGLARLTLPVRKIYHRLRRNTLAGSRRNIKDHYDLSNDFYRIFLDETMTYSCGIFENPESTLKEASTAKYDRICRKLNLSDKDHVLEIGTGWGGFAFHAVENYGCRVTTTTLSREQFEYTREKIADRGLGDRIQLLNEDYRNMEGLYDKVVSIEMIEAVGHQYLKTFFNTLSRLLKPDGKAAIQGITIRDQQYAEHTRSVDFIKRYIFPGSCLVSVTALAGAATKASDLRLFHLEDITPHYAETLRQWRLRFMDRLDEVRALGFSESFIRMWEYYLCYCEAAFAEHYIGTAQAIFFKPDCREPTPLGLPGSPGTRRS